MRKDRLTYSDQIEHVTWLQDRKQQDVPGALGAAAILLVAEVPDVALPVLFAGTAAFVS